MGIKGVIFFAMMKEITIFDMSFVSQKVYT